MIRTFENNTKISKNSSGNSVVLLIISLTQLNGSLLSQHDISKTEEI